MRRGNCFLPMEEVRKWWRGLLIRGGLVSYYYYWNRECRKGVGGCGLGIEAEFGY